MTAACANHKPIQHRDGRPPWCENCQRDNKPPSRLAADLPETVEGVVERAVSEIRALMETEVVREDLEQTLFPTRRTINTDGTCDGCSETRPLVLEAGAAWLCKPCADLDRFVYLVYRELPRLLAAAVAAALAPREEAVRTHDEPGCFALNCDLNHEMVKWELNESLRAQLAENEEWGYGLLLDVIHRHAFHDHDCQTTMCKAKFLWNSHEMTQLLADAYERGGKDALAPREEAVTFPTPDERCAECGSLASRQNPDDPTIRGCAGCFAHWPPLAPHRADEGALTEDEREAMRQAVLTAWAETSQDEATDTVTAAVKRILTARLAAAGGRDTLAEGVRALADAWEARAGALNASPASTLRHHARELRALLSAPSEGNDEEGGAR